MSRSRGTGRVQAGVAYVQTPTTPASPRRGDGIAHSLNVRCGTCSTEDRMETTKGQTPNASRPAGAVPGRLRALVVSLALASACHSASPTQSGAMRTRTASRLASLRAFARLYGVIRWFHPSDAAAAIDWDRFAVDGVRRVMDAPDAGGLRAVLDELFAPVAPTMHFAAPGESFPDEPALHPVATTGLDVVAWGALRLRRHRGSQWIREQASAS